MSAGASDKPLLAGVQPSTVIAVTSVILFIALCKAYNVFIAKPKEHVTDLTIAKMAILGVISVLFARVSITTLFEQRLSFTSAVGIEQGNGAAFIPKLDVAAPPPPPRLTRVVPT